MLYIPRLIWDVWNVEHIARHQVVPEEVEEVCHGRYIHRESYKGRIMLIGLTSSNRILAIILAPQDAEGLYYPVTARTANRQERRLYQEEQSGDRT